MDVRKPRDTSIDPDWSVQQVLERFWIGPDRPYQGADIASYLYAGRHVLRTGKWHKDYVEFWPPGMPLTIAAVIGLTGEDRYPAKMVALAVLLWSVALFAVLRLTPPSRRTTVSAALVGSTLLLPQLWSSNFGGGCLGTESYSHVFFLLSVCAALAAIVHESLPHAAFSAASFGLAAHYRAAFEIQGKVLFTALAVIASIVFLANRSKKRWLLMAGLAFVVFQATLAPWRLYKDHHFGSTAWYDAPDYHVYVTLWVPDEQQHWLLRGGNAACHADPPACRELQARWSSVTGEELKHRAWEVLARHPLRWIGFKLSNFGWMWFNRDLPHLFLEPRVALEGVLLLLMGIGGWIALAWLSLARWRPTAFAVLTTLTLLIGINAAIFLILHFEWRYSQPLRTICLFLPLWAAWMFRETSPRLEQHEARDGRSRDEPAVAG